MTRNFRKVLCTILAAALVLSSGAVFANAANTSFTDVPDTHWAHGYIQACADKGIVSGIGNGRFDPDGQVTYAQFCVMAINAFYPELLDKSAGGVWYAPYMNAARNAGLLSGTAAASSDAAADASMTRYDMAQMLCNALARAGSAATPAQKSEAQARISDWSSIPDNYRDAVSACFALKLLSGMGGGSFGGAQSMTRAQACVVLTRLEEAVGNGGAAPVTPSVKEIEVTTTTTQWGTGYYVADNGFGDGCLNNGKPITEENVLELLAEAEKIWPTGTSWFKSGTANNHWYQDSGSVVSGIISRQYSTSSNYACGGFAAMISDYLFGRDGNPAHLVTDHSKIRPGDILIYMQNGQPIHVNIAVNCPSAGNVWTADGNVSNKVGWPDYKYSAPASEAIFNSFGQTWEVWSRYPA